MDKELKKLKALLLKNDNLRKSIPSQIKKAFPVGKIVTFKKGRGVITAEILKVSDYWWASFEVYVMNVKSQKEYWVSVTDLIGGK